MSQSLDAIFKPTSIAVIGASTKQNSIGRVVLHNIINSDFQGKVFPVNPRAEVIHSIKCYPSILEIPDPIDLAIIIVKRDLVKNVLEECGEKGIKAVVVITAGFKEIGEAGAEKESEILKIAQKYNMRMVGPNCFGVLNTNPAVSLNATFAKHAPPAGNIGFISQSGALGETILDYAGKLNLGFSMFASVGNKADISGNDLLEYWENDPRTELILMYLENFGNPRRFTEIAQRISKNKPIIAVKAGRTDAGARAVSSHTGVLATIEVGIDACFAQCGVQRVSTVEELFDLALAFSKQPLPRGDRVAIITNAGGPGILATDAVVSMGLQMAHFSNETIETLRKNLPPEAALHNPVDVIASGGPAAYYAAVKAALQDPNVDALMIIFVPPVLVNDRAVVASIVDAIKQAGQTKTIVGCFMGKPEGIGGSELMVAQDIPLYAFPESASRALSAMIKYSRWKEKLRGAYHPFSGGKTRVERIIQKAIEENRQNIAGQDAMDILAAYDIPTAKSVAIADESAISAAISQVGLPCVLKLDDDQLLHKSDTGGVIVDLRSEAEVRDAFQTMKNRFAENFSGVILQEMIRGGVETVMGMTYDPAFGPLMMFGLGGIYVEIMKDVAFKIHPITDLDAREMISSIKGYPLLRGFRGSRPVDIDILTDVLLRLNQLVSDFPQLGSFDINPFIASADAATSRAVDAKFVLKTPTAGGF